MAITAFSQWSATAALNLDLNNIPLDSAVMTASQVDDALREMMSQLKSAGFITSGIFSATITPSVNDGAALGTAALSWSDLFLASGAVINIANARRRRNADAGHRHGGAPSRARHARPARDQGPDHAGSRQVLMT
jgi:hypothetical protein